MKKLSLAFVLALSVLAVNVAVASAAKVRNGGFEHHLAGWTQDSDEDGSWNSVMKGDEPGALATPKRGKRQAIVEQGAPGARILTQTVKLRRKQRHRLSMWVQYENSADIFASPNSFETEFILSRPAWTERPRGGPTVPSNQQLRIEVLKAKAPVRTTNRRQILATVLRTRPGDPLKMGWTRYHVKLNKFAGKRVKLRIAEVDNEGEFFVGVDDVKVKSKRKPRKHGKKGKKGKKGHGKHKSGK